MTDDEIKELRRLHELIDAFQKRPVKEMAACVDVAEAGQRMSKLLWEKLPALLTTAERVRELERDLNDQLKVESDRDAEISVERQRRMTAELQNGRDAARIRDLEARIKELEAENARLRADVEGYQDYIDSGADR
jgi:multidrug resistance efflux pump